MKLFTNIENNKNIIAINDIDERGEALLFEVGGES